MRSTAADQGSQYAAVEYRRLLYIGGFRQSMSRKGNCYDNAQAESFFARFKTELVEGRLFESVEQARSETFSYIEGYYNRIRLHSGLGYKSPMEFEKELKIKNETRSVRIVSCSTWFFRAFGAKGEKVVNLWNASFNFIG